MEKIVQVTVPIQLLSVAVMSVIICYVVLIQNIPVNATHVKTAIVHELESTNCKFHEVSCKERTTLLVFQW